MNYFAAVIGQMNIDFIFQGVETLPEPGEEVLASNFKICLGGGPMVIPYHLSRLGVPTRFGTFMGDDFESKMARDLLDSIKYENVEVLSSEANIPVVATSVLSTKYERSFICYNSNVDESSIDSKVLSKFFKGSKVAYFPKNMEIVKELVQDGCQLILDVAWDNEMKLSDFVERLKYVTYFTPNDKEAKKLCGESDILKCLDMLGEYIATPFIKLGMNGVIAKIDGQYIRVPGLDVFNSIDPTGAGDNFLAGLIYGIYLKMSFIDCLKIANIVGGLSTEVIGCYRSEISPELVMSYFDKYPEPNQVFTRAELDTLLARE